MNDGCILFRAANPGDVSQIRRLLHANCRSWNEPSNLADLETLYLLYCRDQLLGVLCGTEPAAKAVVHWVEVHPLYAEKLIREIMVREFQGIRDFTLKAHRSAAVCVGPSLPAT